MSYCFGSDISSPCIYMWVIIHNSGLGNMSLFAENINLATFILCTYFSFRSFICISSGSVWSL